jgi:hypothetical protein
MAEPRPATLRACAGQGLLYALFATVIGVFSRWPVVHPIDADQALIKVSFIHAGKPVGDCRAQSEAELAKLPPNMRAPTKCPRERSPVSIEVDVNGRPALRRAAQPSGLSRDGASALYQRIAVGAGEQRIAVRVSDDARQPGFAYQREQTVRLAPAQVLVIDFDAERGGITLQ